MTVDDIPYNPGDVYEQSPATRLTLQHFVGEDVLGRAINTFAPHNSDARQPEDTSEWPPATIIDHVYACSALKAWGPRPFIDFVWNRSKDIYYANIGDDVPIGEVGYADMSLGDQGPERFRRHTIRNEYKMRTASFTDQSEKSSFLSLMDGVAALWMRSSKEGKHKVHSDGVSDHTCNHDDIKMWLKSMEESRQK